MGSRWLTIAVTPKDEPGVNNWLETHWARTDTQEIDLEESSILHLHICIIT